MINKGVSGSAAVHAFRSGTSRRYKRHNHHYMSHRPPRPLDACYRDSFTASFDVETLLDAEHLLDVAFVFLFGFGDLRHS